MALVRKIGTFWILILGCVVTGYFCAYNREWVPVTIPHLKEMRIRAADLFIWTFCFGALCSFSFFMVDYVAKLLTIRKLTQKVRSLEAGSLMTTASSSQEAESNQLVERGS